MIMSMMHGVVFAAHDGLCVTIHGIMNIGRPNCSEEDHGDMSDVMTRDEEEPKDVW